VVGLRPRVLVVGAGAAGTLTAVHLLRASAAETTPLEVVLLDPAVRWARGAGFGTTDPLHLLNVRAAGMSALPDVPDDFVTWRHRSGLHGGPDTFAPRREWSRYLADTLYAARQDAAGRAVMTHRRARALGLRPSDSGLAVSTSDGDEVRADAVVVATGLPPAGVGWAPEALRTSPRFIADPWLPGALDRVRRAPAGEVLLVGTGLTMVDVALTLAGSHRLVATSRSGRLPAPHTVTALPGMIPDVTDWGSDLAAIRVRAHAHIEAVRRRTGDWRPGVDGLRHRVAELWQRLSEADRAEFLARDAGPWGAVRHRMPPSSAAAIQAMREDGRLTFTTAEVTGAGPGPGRWVVNCTGPRADVRTLGEPLLDDLLRPRPAGALATTSTAGMGVRTRDGRVVDALGETSAPLWTLGALRRGELWESTAIPEIRTQAHDLAADILAALAVPAQQIAG
jgi:uncharacterized NAD(P)/FAD-binding protein YdhS